MIKLPRSATLLSALLALVVLSGCGGDDGGGSSKPSVRRFEGPFENDPTDGVVNPGFGAAYLNVASNGEVTGEAFDARFSRGDVTGRIAGDGSTELTIVFVREGQATQTRVSIGTLTEQNGRLRGTLQEQGDQNPYKLTYDLALKED